jgi:cephalosporin hydroxylase
MGKNVSAITVGLALLVLALAGLNVYQLVSAPTMPAPTVPPRGPATPESPGTPQTSDTAPNTAATTKTTPAQPADPLKVDFTEAEKKEAIDRFHKISYEQQFGYWFHPVQGGLPHTQNEKGYGTPSRWIGIVTAQNPFDAWIHQEIIAEVKPDFIVETGTYFGGSAIMWAMVFEQVNPTGRVLTVDIDDKLDQARKVPIFNEKVDFFKGSSTDAKIVAEITKRVQGKKVMVILDSAHHKSHVDAELKAYSPLVSVGSYLIVQDTNFNGHPILPNFGAGPYEAVEDFLRLNPDFVPDRTRERFLFTIHPKGYLKRVR